MWSACVCVFYTIMMSNKNVEKNKTAKTEEWGQVQLKERILEEETLCKFIGKGDSMHVFRNTEVFFARHVYCLHCKSCNRNIVKYNLHVRDRYIYWSK